MQRTETPSANKRDQLAMVSYEKLRSDAMEHERIRLSWIRTKGAHLGESDMLTVSSSIPSQYVSDTVHVGGARVQSHEIVDSGLLPVVLESSQDF